jgi:hypothetical protein
MSVDDELDAMHEAMDQLLDRIVDANPQLRAAQWTPLVGTTNAPSTGEEAEPPELDHRVAIHRCDQCVLLDDPANDA